MRAVLSTTGSRGEVQPLVALALQLSALGRDVRVCVPPDFCDWVEGLGISSVPLGPPMRPAAAAAAAACRPYTPSTRDLSTPEGRRQAAESAVAAQFAALPQAARECDVLVSAGAVQVAARSVAELLGIGYVHAEYCPTALPSPRHAPAPWPGWPRDDTGVAGNRERWAADARRWNDTWGAALNAHRAAAGLAPVGDVRDHVLTDRPWLAADPALGPWPERGVGNGDRSGDRSGGGDVFQTGAWLLPDERPLPAEVESFLEAGDPPVYFGLGSMHAPGDDVSHVVATAARTLGRRVIVSRGWADLSPADGGRDCIAIGEVNHRALFGRVAAVVHHGGAGTTTAVARAGTPQVLLPRIYDQHYWAERVDRLGIGVGVEPPFGMPTPDSLAHALASVMEPGVAARADAFAAEVCTDGARAAAQRLLDQRALGPAGPDHDPDRP